MMIKHSLSVRLTPLSDDNESGGWHTALRRGESEPSVNAKPARQQTIVSNAIVCECLLTTD